MNVVYLIIMMAASTCDLVITGLTPTPGVAGKLRNDSGLVFCAFVTMQYNLVLAK